MSLTQDASHGWLALRFSMCNDKLEHRSGAVGVFRIASLRQSHAVKIREATVTILKNLCEPTARMPRSRTKRNLALRQKTINDDHHHSDIDGDDDVDVDVDVVDDDDDSDDDDPFH